MALNFLATLHKYQHNEAYMDSTRQFLPTKRLFFVGDAFATNDAETGLMENWLNSTEIMLVQYCKFDYTSGYFVTRSGIFK